MNRLTADNWDLRPKLRNMLYAVVTERIILYSAPIWYNCKVVIANRLFSMQRGLLCVSKCYSTVSTGALHVSFVVLVLDLRAKLDRDFTALVRWNKGVDGTGLDSESCSLWSPTPRQKDLWRIRLASDLIPRTTCTYYTRRGQNRRTTLLGARFSICQRADRWGKSVSSHIWCRSIRGHCHCDKGSKLQRTSPRSRRTLCLIRLEIGASSASLSCATIQGHSRDK